MEAPAAEASAAENAAAEESDGYADAGGTAIASDAAEDRAMSTFGGNDEQGDREAMTQLPVERSPWPMVLFTGVALMVGAALLRWILVPRAG